MIINKITRKSHAWNEDRFVIGKDFYLVIDGATPLIKDKKQNLACLMVKYIKENIGKYQGRIKDRLVAIAKDLYLELGLNTDDTSYLPSASLSYVERIEDKYYIGVVGDCEVCVVSNNLVTRYYDDSLSKLDAISLEKMKNAAIEKDIDIVNARAEIIDTLIKHRRMLNKPGGYNGYTLGENFKLNVKEEVINVNDVDKMYLYSDGFSSAFTTFKLYPSFEEMFLNISDIKEEVKNITKRAYDDAKCNKYPRFKLIDDITVVEIINE